MLRKILALLCVFLMPIPVSAATLVFNDQGQIIGASGVSFLTETYNVSFEEGSCLSLFDGCNASTFAFHDLPTAVAAAQALLTQTFSIEPGWAYGANKIAGCSDASQCRIMIPSVYVGPHWGGASVSFFSGLMGFGPAFELADKDSLLMADSVYARFELVSSNPVPEPSVWFMMLLGLFATGAALRHRKSALLA